jgi:hypothetical protein
MQSISFTGNTFGSSQSGKRARAPLWQFRDCVKFQPYLLDQSIGTYFYNHAGTMRVHVESYPDGHAADAPKRFWLHGRDIEVIDNIDQWHGPDYRYFKLKGDDGNLYILRLDEARAEWELIMFQRSMG